MIVKNESVRQEDLGDGLERKILASGGRMMMVEVYFQKDARGAVHSHPHEQVSYILSGSFEVEINGEKQNLKAGDSFYVSPNVLHGVLALEESTILDIFTPQREDFLK